MRANIKLALTTKTVNLRWRRNALGLESTVTSLWRHCDVINEPELQASGAQFYFKTNRSCIVQLFYTDSCLRWAVKR